MARPPYNSSHGKALVIGLSTVSPFDAPEPAMPTPILTKFVLLLPLLGAAAGASSATLDPATSPSKRGAASAASLPALSGLWTTKSSLPFAVAEIGATALNGVMHVVGGTKQADGQPPQWASTTHLVYDPAKDAWSERAPLPIALSHVGVATLDGKLYAVGGFTNVVHIGPQKVAFVYDPRSNAWTRLPDISGMRGSVAVAAANGKLHIFGGRNSSEVIDLPMPPGAPKMQAGFGTVTTHQIFDPRVGRWQDGAALPSPGRDHVGVALVAGKIHLFGGRVKDTVDNLTTHEVYDSTADTWSKAAPLPTARSSGAYAVVQGRIIYAGGECKPGGDPSSMTNANAYDEVTVYDGASDRWTELPPLPSARHAFGAVALGNVAYFAGGAPVCGGGASKDFIALQMK